MESISSELAQVRKERDEYKEMYLRMATECASYERRLEQEMLISDKYRTWFARNAHWTQRFNNMMKYDPRLGNYNRKGADEKIIIPPKPVYILVETAKKMSTVDDTEEAE